MRRILSLAIIPLIALSVLAVLYIVQHEAMDKAMQGEGNGTFYEKKRVIAAAAEPFGGVSGSSSPWKDRLEEVIEDCVRAIKDHLPASVGHRVKNLPTSLGHRINPHLAPPGVYFTLLDLSVPTRFGITGIPAGTQVVCVKDDGATLLVKWGNLEFKAKRQDLTSNLDIADASSVPK